MTGVRELEEGSHGRLPEGGGTDMGFAEQDGKALLWTECLHPSKFTRGNLYPQGDVLDGEPWG